MGTNLNYFKIVAGKALILMYIFLKYSCYMKYSAPFVHNFDRAALSSFFFSSSALLLSLWGRRKLKAHSKIIIAFLPSCLPASDFLPQSKQTDGNPPISAKKNCGRASQKHWRRSSWTANPATATATAAYLPAWFPAATPVGGDVTGHAYLPSPRH